jgi:hypothetical protein
MPLRAAVLGALAAAFLGLASPASAQLPGQPVAAKNAEFVKNFAQHTDSAGAKRVGHYFYITTERDLTIYDTSTPEDPKQVGHLDFPATDVKNYYYPQEDPDTNGNILLTTDEGAVEVIDVSDKANPKFLSKLAGSKQHTITCVLDCTWAYGSCGSLSCKTGEIVDLRDPAHPKVVGDWVKQLPAAMQPNSNHDVTEVAPGMLLTSSTPMLLLDARTDPAHPTVVATAGKQNDPFVHANLWPHEMQDDLVLVGGESIGPGCDADAAAAFQTWDASAWRTTGKITPLDQFRIPYGLAIDGQMPNSTYCVHWFTTHPTYRNGGLIAISWYEQGTRFLQIDRSGKISELGWFVPLGTTASAAYWISDRIVYVSDYNRGLDVIRYTGPIIPGEPAPAG